MPLPTDPALRALCDAFLRAPHIHDAPARWAAVLNVSERTLTRRFRDGTGLSFATWRRRACVLHAVGRLAGRTPVTEVAAALGYESPAAFTAAFTSLLGRPPTTYGAPAERS